MGGGEGWKSSNTKRSWRCSLNYCPAVNICFRLVASKVNFGGWWKAGFLKAGFLKAGSWVCLEGKSELAARPHDLYCIITNGVIPWRMGRLENSPYPMRLTFDAIFKYKSTVGPCAGGENCKSATQCCLYPSMGSWFLNFVIVICTKKPPGIPLGVFPPFLTAKPIYLVVPFVHSSFYFSRKKKEF